MVKNKDYVEQPYTARFLSGITPINLQFVAHCLGYEVGTDLSKPFHYVDLGCGKALTLVMLASIYPESEFIGVDINPAHIDFNETLVKSAKLNNVRFIKEDIAKLKAKDIPKSDFIVAHGILGWVDDKTRNSLLKLMSSRLRDSGIGYLNYNALPGLAPILPIHDLVHRLYQPKQSHDALVFLTNLIRDKARYFEANPQAIDAIKQFLKNPLTGEIHFQHEFFSAHWRPFYAHQVVEMAQQHDLTFLGQSNLKNNIDDLTIPAELQSLLKEIDNEDSQQTMRDYLINSFSRSDLFVKQKPVNPSYEEFKQYYCIALHTTMPETINVGGNTYTLKGEIYQTLFDLISKNQLTVGELTSHKSLKNKSEQKLLEMVKVLFALNIIAPSLDKNNEPDHQTLASKMNITINTIMLPLCIEENMRMIPLISPLLGNAAMIPLDQAWLLTSLIEHGQNEEAIKQQFVTIFKQVSKRMPQLKLTEGASIETVFNHSLNNFNHHTLPMLKHLTIVDG